MNKVLSEIQGHKMKLLHTKISEVGDLLVLLILMLKFNFLGKTFVIVTLCQQIINNYK